MKQELAMRVSREVMERHHEEIVAAGAKMLRSRGIEGLSVADVMREAGLTHGGFYRHFNSKDDFVREASEAAFADVERAREGGAPASDPLAQLRGLIEFYVSKQHLENASAGCPIAAFGNDAMRSTGPVKLAFAEGVERMLEWIEERMKLLGISSPGRAAELVSVMVGALVAARSTGNADVSERLLEAARLRALELISTDSG